MPKPSVELPNIVTHTAHYRVAEGDINHANYLAAVSVIPIAMRAQEELMEQLGLDPESSETGMLMASSQVDYISESYLDDLLEISIYLVELDDKSIDLFFRFRDSCSQREIARIKIRMLFFDYLMRRVVAVPNELRNSLGSVGVSNG